jgi:hypothetical protein
MGLINKIRMEQDRCQGKGFMSKMCLQDKDETYLKDKNWRD